MRTDIRPKLYLKVGLLAMTLAAVVSTAVAGMSVLSSLRSYIDGEARWAKAQKDAVRHLSLYAQYRDEADYAAYLERLRIPLSGRKARLALEQDPPDRAAAAEGFREVGIHPDDVPGVCRLFVHFRRFGHMAEAVAIWERGDALIEELRVEGEAIRRLPRGGDPRRNIERLAALDARLDRLEDRFAEALGKASRWATRASFAAMAAGSALVCGLSLLAVLLISGRIASGIREISQAAARAGEGDLSARVKTSERDELGRLGEDFNRMQESLARKTLDLESFSYSVAHDLRSALGKLQAHARLLDELGEAGVTAAGAPRLARVLESCRRMDDIIDGLLKLSHLSRHELRLESVDIGALARGEAEQLRAAETARRVKLSVAEGLETRADAAFVRIIMRNLLKNSWKFTSRRESAHIEVGGERKGGERVFWVKDDGAGFDMVHAGRLFEAFSRLHSSDDFPGTGIGLATVRRAVERHGGRVWAEGADGRGAAFYFTLGPRT